VCRRENFDMTKPSQRHASHVQPEKPEAVDKSLPTPAAPTEPVPSIQTEKARGRLWLALVVWTFVFGFLFVYLLIDLVFSLFRG
jgi:hypothetical protein